jgi:iron-sulfur cluster repair protein YtfE (RIC family)
MITSLGKRAQRPSDLVGLLLDCHERIRRFTALAQTIGLRRDAPDAEVIEACASVERYFARALPLHVADEEESILPRLRGLDPELDRALSHMHVQHQGHAAPLARLLGALAAVAVAPEAAASRAHLAAVATELEQAFEEHLALEESVIFPRLARLERHVQDEVLRELRARRAGGAESG